MDTHTKSVHVREAQPHGLLGHGGDTVNIRDIEHTPSDEDTPSWRATVAANTRMVQVFAVL